MYDVVGDPRASVIAEGNAAVRKAAVAPGFVDAFRSRRSSTIPAPGPAEEVKEAMCLHNYRGKSRDPATSCPLRLRVVGQRTCVCVLIAALMFGAEARRVLAQDEAPDPGSIAVAGLYGRHAFGIGAEFGLHKRFAAVLRAEGWPYSRLAVVGAGGRVEAIAERSALFYVHALLGGIQCTRFGADAGGYSCSDNDWHAGGSASIGLELVLSEDYSWSAGVEGGYWFARHRSATDLDHFSFAAVVRYRSPDLRR